MIEEFGKIRQDFYESLSTFDTFGRGWTRRNSETTKKALEMVEEDD
jgi:lysozyme family protein